MRKHDPDTLTHKHNPPLPEKNSRRCFGVGLLEISIGQHWAQKMRFSGSRNTKGYPSAMNIIFFGWLSQNSDELVPEIEVHHQSNLGHSDRILLGQVLTLGGEGIHTKHTRAHQMHPLPAGVPAPPLPPPLVLGEELESGRGRTAGNQWTHLISYGESSLVQGST